MAYGYKEVLVNTFNANVLVIQLELLKTKVPVVVILASLWNRTTDLLIFLIKMKHKTILCLAPVPHPEGISAHNHIKICCKVL
jgi:hypothetical protein